MYRLIILLAIFFGGIQTASAAGHLEIEQAWIRAAPPGARMLAGYALLRNRGDAPVVIVGADSPAFGSVSLHESFEENGVARMRALGRVEIAPGTVVTFAPGGRHFMLMQPKRELRPGESIKIHLDTDAGSTDADFVVRADAP